MKQQTSSNYFDLRSAREENQYKRLITDNSSNPHDKRLNTNISNKAMAILVSPQQQQENYQRHLDFSSDDHNKQVNHQSSNSYQGLQQMQNYLSSEGDELLSDNNNFDQILSTNDRKTSLYFNGPTVLHTNQTSSSLKNAPMSYSSTQSHGYLNTKLQNLNEIGSPQSLNNDDYIKTHQQYQYQSERQPRFTDTNINSQGLLTRQQSSAKKSVKFIDEQRDEQSRGRDSSMVLQENDNQILQISTEQKYQDVDSSQIIQARIDQRMHEINKRYFSNEPKESIHDKRLKPIIKVLDSSLRDPVYQENNNYHKSQNDINDYEDKDSDTNSIVAMEEAIENQKQKVNTQIDKQYFSVQSGEPSIVINKKQQSVFASTNSFEKLRDEILNHQSINRDSRPPSEFGTQYRQDNFNSQNVINLRHYDLDQGKTMTLTFDKESTFNNKSYIQQDTQNMLSNYVPLRKSRENSICGGDTFSPTQQKQPLNNIIKQKESYKDYASSLQNQNQQYESKLISLKNKISNLHSLNRSISDEYSRERPTYHNQQMINTPTMTDLTTVNQRSGNSSNRYNHNHLKVSDTPQYSQEILILQPGNEYQTTSRDNSQERETSNIQTKDLRQKIMELKQSISDNEGEQANDNTLPLQQQNRERKNRQNSMSSKNLTFDNRQRSSSRNGTININTMGSIQSSKNTTANQSRRLNMNISLKQLHKPSSNQTERTSNLRQTSNSRTQQPNDQTDQLKKKIRWLEKRNLEYSLRLRDLQSEKNQDQVMIQELQKEIKAMSAKINHSHQDNRAAHNFEQQRIRELQQQVSDISKLVNQKHNKFCDKENDHPNTSSQNITNTTAVNEGDSSMRLQALRVNQLPLNEKKAPIVPLRNFQKPTESSSKNRKPDSSFSTIERSRSAKKTSYQHLRQRSTSASKTIEHQNNKEDLTLLVNKARNKSKSKERKGSVRKSKSKGKSKSKERKNKKV